jgi:acetyltransferase-like isoleucine patch superfamily enzyme
MIPNSKDSNSYLSHIGKGAKIGKNVSIWNFCYIGNNSVIGDAVSIGSLSHIDYGVKIGKGTRIEGMVYIPPKTRIGENVFLGPGVVITNDPYPTSKKLVGVQIEDSAIIGAGAVLKAGVKIGHGSVIGMGSLVLDDVPPETVVFGSPAKPKYKKSDYDRKRVTWENS